ncbi:integrator complex subunit 12-like [Argiope bruennichi]|uniref:Integrator complex subunit 12 n=1 Tax=Argiope bruennichi TaxID=94029 RepID=A0A8T0ESX8_ARGBR|nr:integrator complex subunit 12-like [Argiope bruennichi]XP_055943675.1 integrator complex subunit 12-like [Argiope bruennichi]XP_055943676.1 integrator complex subunit 12-like [Argiope bruennichi]KAF8777119.1 Integrator complex subunit 12 like protein [Argiope bruennichi]
MASTDLDPLFVKGLRLLHSKNKDSTEQLKQLLDEVIAQTKQSGHSKDRIYTSIKVEDSKLHIKKTSREVSESSNFSSKYSSEESRERKAEKRQLEKMKQESIEVEAKIPKLEPPQVYSYYPSSPPDLPTLDQYVIKKDEESDSSEENADADDFAMEMGLACVICKSLDVTQGNQLIECQECHNLYHQECHKPPATDDYNDPRRVWYCAKCVKNMKKMATKTQKTTKSGMSMSSKETISQTKGTRSEGSPPAAILPFKRAELKTTISQGNNQTTANKPIGLAGLAANFGGRTVSSSSTTSLATATRGTKATTAGISQKSHVPFSTATTSKTSSFSSSSNLLTKPTPSNTFQSSSTTSQSTTASTSQKASTSTAATKGLGLLSAAVAATANRSTSSAPSGNGNSGHKVPSCSPLMSADKRLQIMKKKASKMQERRRLSNK